MKPYTLNQINITDNVLRAVYNIDSRSLHARPIPERIAIIANDVDTQEHLRQIADKVKSDARRIRHKFNAIDPKISRHLE